MIPRGRVVAGLVVVTVAVIGVDLSHPAATAPLREAAASVVGPVQRALTVDRAPEVTRLERERTTLRHQLDSARARLRDARGVDDVLHSASARGRRVLPARVVGAPAVGAPDPTRRITIDAGSRDGITTDLTVICADGLVGRVVSVAPFTSDVLVLGDRRVTVGVRVGTHRTLGSVSSQPVPGLPPREPGELTLTLVEPGSTKPGDRVTTLGSVDGRPFVAGVPVGRVVRVDPQRGRLARTAVVRPTVDPSTLDVVAVVLPTARRTAGSRTTRVLTSAASRALAPWSTSWTMARRPISVVISSTTTATNAQSRVGRLGRGGRRLIRAAGAPGRAARRAAGARPPGRPRW